MQKFIYRPNDNGTYAVVGYQGDEANVRIPDTYGGGIITIVGDKLFSGHAEIESVSIPDTVTDMGEFVFDGCVNLRCIDLPADLECLWGYTFVRCGIEEITLPDVRCGIEEITLPDKLVTLPPFAFKDCKNLRKITCGKGLKKIYAWVFSGCDSFEELIKNETVEVSERAFDTKELNT